ncbi:hypothetical protein PIB30_094630, partial [Stylosanthes scabra]|nr:hypothetical protein [Stylosanthes scabra]
MGSFEDVLPMKMLIQCYGIVMALNMVDILVVTEQLQKCYNVVFIGQPYSRILMPLREAVTSVKELAIFQGGRKCPRTLFW